MIQYKVQDIFSDKTLTHIVHQVNCQGVMGSGIAKIIKERYPEAFEAYLNRLNELSGKALGEISVGISNDVTIINQYSQNYYGNFTRHTDYESFYKAQEKIKDGLDFHLKSGVKIFHLGIPYKIGSDLAGGDWNIIRSILYSVWYGSDVKVSIFMLPRYEKELERELAYLELYGKDF